MNIYQKLIEVRKASGGAVQKDAENKFEHFNYASSGAVLGLVREAMNEQGLLIVPEIIDQTQKEGSGNKWAITVKILFTIINAEKPDEKIEVKWTQNASGGSDKAIGSAMTYAEKYLMLKLFNIETSNDDPDAKKNDKPIAYKKKSQNPYENEIYDTALGLVLENFKSDPKEWIEFCETHNFKIVGKSDETLRNMDKAQLNQVIDLLKG